MLFFFFENSQAQWNLPNDSLLLRNIQADDTTKVQEMPEIYKKIEKKAKRDIGKKLINSLLVEPQPTTAQEIKSPIVAFQPYKGKIINNIRIIVLDPFGTDISRPDSVISHTGFTKIANELHTTSKEYIIRNNLQFKKGDEVNPAIIAETETFLRELGYIHDARIQLDSIPLSNEVQVTVAVQDVFPIGLDVHSISGSSVNMEVFDRNFLGQGSELGVTGIYKKKYSQHFGYGVDYTYRNVRRTFIDMEASYLDNINARTVDVSITRPLLTSLQHFGEIGYTNSSSRIDVVGWDSISPNHINSFSASLGKAFDLPYTYSTRRLALAVHFEQQFPSYQNVTLPDNRLTPYEYAKKRLWLMQVSLYQQAYYREFLVNNFGVTEDIAHGYNISAQFGYNQYIQYEDGVYASFSASGGHEFKSGNYYAMIALASNFNERHAYESIIKSTFRYYTPLAKLGKNRFRQFVNINYTKLLNSIHLYDNSVAFSQWTHLNTGSFSEDMKGSERLMINLESDLFSSWNLAGFRFVFFNFWDLGWLTSNRDLLSNNNNFAWGVGLGARIRNELLVFKTINIKIGFYPNFNQDKVSQFINMGTSYPQLSPNFIPDYPKEISLE